MGPRELTCRSEGIIAGRLFTRTEDPSAAEPAPKMRMFFGGPAIRLRPQFLRHQCATCGRLDERACFKQGLPEDVAMPKRSADLVLTQEFFQMWSRRLADAVLDFAPDHVEIYPIPRHPDHVVPWPKQLILPAPGLKRVRSTSKQAFRPESGTCTACGRYGSMSFWSEYFTVPEGTVIAAVGIDTDHPPALVRILDWIVSAELAERLRKQKFLNVALKPSYANS